MNKLFLHKNIKPILLICVGLLLGFKVIPAKINPIYFFTEEQNEAGLNLECVTGYRFDSVFNEKGTEVEKLSPNFCGLSNYLWRLNCEGTSVKMIIAKVFFVKSNYIAGNESDLPPPLSFFC